MKTINIKLKLFVINVILLMLVACGKDDKPSPWDGQWQRTIAVPVDMQGRCVNETLGINAKQWHLKIVVHATFKCDQPFLELGYTGVIKEIKIRKNTQDKDIRLQVSGIHLSEMVDVGGERRMELTTSTIDTLSDKYVPKQHQFYEQHAYLSEDNNSMESDIFRPVLDLAIPLYPENTKPSAYARVK